MLKFILTLCALIAFASRAAVAAPTDLKPLFAAGVWLNGHPTAAMSHGKVVVVDVFTFGCINCKHVVPELRSLYKATSRKDVLIYGIHSPETPYEHERANVVENLSLQGITWPVALDNSLALWNAYGIQYWPSQLIFDRKGVLRKTIIGEGQDALLESTVAALVKERP
ncbi:MAG: redoxin domain-containing protein [Candidatus Eremiobacteraeota bacterium]|nr:redoxin domain-containing protein [Candidatus Eremiobacteraeota bacterium]